MDEDAEAVMPALGRNPEENRRQSWNQAFYSCSYLVYELICYAALLSLAIGMSTLCSFISEYFFTIKFGIFLQTYITLFILVNFAFAQARHQIIYLYPLRAKFGNYASCCFYCNYPWSIWFGLLTLAYVNLFYQFSKFLCDKPLGGAHVHNGSFRGHNGSLAVQLTGSKWSESWGWDVGWTTAFFLFSLCTIQYMTCRKLRWDFHMELAHMHDQPPEQHTCATFCYALVVISFVQAVLVVLYTLPLLLWLLLSRMFQWEISTTIISTIGISLGIGHFGSYVESQEPFPTFIHSRLYQIVNLKVRINTMCLVYIPLICHWFFKAEVDPCIPVPSSKYEPSDVDTFNFFLLNVAVCVFNTVKYSLLTGHALRGRRERAVVLRGAEDNNRVRPDAPLPPMDRCPRNFNSSNNNNNGGHESQRTNEIVPLTDNSHGLAQGTYPLDKWDVARDSNGKIDVEGNEIQRTKTQAKEEKQESSMDSNLNVMTVQETSSKSGPTTMPYIRLDSNNGQQSLENKLLSCPPDPDVPSPSSVIVASALVEERKEESMEKEIKLNNKLEEERCIDAPSSLSFGFRQKSGLFDVVAVQSKENQLMEVSDPRLRSREDDVSTSNSRSPSRVFSYKSSGNSISRQQSPVASNLQKKHGKVKHKLRYDGDCDVYERKLAQTLVLATPPSPTIDGASIADEEEEEDPLPTNTHNQSRCSAYNLPINQCPSRMDGNVDDEDEEDDLSRDWSVEKLESREEHKREERSGSRCVTPAPERPKNSLERGNKGQVLKEDLDDGAALDDLDSSSSSLAINNSSKNKSNYK